jgi:aryl-alcohol dehydrogenase-like predicted oxidoreductase
LGKTIKKINVPRSKIVVATKVFFTVTREVSFTFPSDASDTADYINQNGLSRKHIFDAVEGSLERLGLDCIDLYQIHHFDYASNIIIYTKVPLTNVFFFV